VKSDRAILEERAAALARPITPPSRDTVELLTFRLAQEVYGVESRHVGEVFALTQIARVPGAQPPMYGLTAWRGEILSVFDIRPVLGVATNALNDLGRVIVLGEGGAAFGVLVDGVREVMTVPVSEIREPGPGVAAAREYVRGVTGHAVVVLAAERLLTLHA
jgi:purine-binding chemotaxis protein CheW